MIYKIYSDGCHLGEFNVAGVGGYLLKDDTTVFEFSEQIKENIYYKIHERYAIKRVLEKSLQEGIEKEQVELFSDDQGLMKILSKSKVNRREYVEENNLLNEICDLCDKFTNITFNYIPRDENARADKLSRQYITETLFKDNQIATNAFSHPKWITKNNFPKGETQLFYQERQLVSNYLVLHFYPNKIEQCMQLDIYYASKDNENISYELNESIQTLNKGWQTSCVTYLDKHLKYMAQKNKKIGLVIHDEYIILDQLLRGRREIPAKTKKTFLDLISTLDNLEKVVVHREPLVYEAIFNDKPSHMKTKTRITI